MKIYLSTFISGLDKPIKDLLKKNLKDIKIDLILDGAVIYQTNISADKIKKLRFLNNTFIIIKTFRNLRERNSLEFMLKSISKLKNLEEIIRPLLNKNNQSFRIMVSDENRFVSANRTLLQKIEKRIINIKTPKLKFNLKKPDTEFWFLKRRENIGFFMLRITKNITNKKLNKGELRRELAHILCYLSEPNKEDVFLDPFSGYGSIPIERAKFGHANLIFATDKIKDYKQYFNKKIKSRKFRDKIIPKTFDATNMEFFKDNFVTKIVTDPPWGDYNQDVNINKFYEEILKEFSRILNKNGIMIILTSKKQEFENILLNFKNFKLKEKYDILVSGKKAGVYKIIKL